MCTLKCWCKHDLLHMDTHAHTHTHTPVLWWDTILWKKLSSRWLYVCALASITDDGEVLVPIFVLGNEHTTWRTQNHIIRGHIWKWLQGDVVMKKRCLKDEIIHVHTCIHVVYTKYIQCTLHVAVHYMHADTFVLQITCWLPVQVLLSHRYGQVRI